MKKGDKVNYTGRGFLGFNPNQTEATILEVRDNDFLIDYDSKIKNMDNLKVLVFKHEVK